MDAKGTFIIGEVSKEQGPSTRSDARGEIKVTLRLTPVRAGDAPRHRVQTCVNS